MTTTPSRGSGAADPARPPGRAQRVVVGVGGALAVFGIAWTAFGFLSVLTREQAVVDSSYSAVDEVAVDPGLADVKIVKSEGSTVRLHQDLEWSFRRPKIVVQQDHQRLSVRARCSLELAWGCTVRLELQVPSTTKVVYRH